MTDVPEPEPEPEIVRFARLVKCLRTLQQTLFAGLLSTGQIAVLRKSEKDTDLVVAWLTRNRRDELLQAALNVQLMRVHQKHFVAGDRSRDTISRSKEMETRVDRWVKLILDPPKETQTRLFDPGHADEVIGLYRQARERNRR